MLVSISFLLKSFVITLKIVLFSEIIIYESLDIVIKLVVVLKKFIKLWKNKDNSIKLSK